MNKKSKEFMQDTIRILVVFAGIVVLLWCVSLWRGEPTWRVESKDGYTAILKYSK